MNTWFFLFTGQDWVTKKPLSIFTLLDTQMEGREGEEGKEEEEVAVCVKCGEGAKKKMGGGGGCKRLSPLCEPADEWRRLWRKQIQF